MGTHTLGEDIVRNEGTNVICVSSIYEKTRWGLGYEFFKRMKQNKDKVAQYIVDTGEVDTYDDLLRRTVRTALHLRMRNFSNKDVVCLCSYNHINSCVPLLACLFLGIPVVSLDPSFNVMEATHLIKLVKPKLFIIVPEFVGVIQESMENAEIESEVLVYGDVSFTEPLQSFNSFLESHEEEASFIPTIIEDVSETAVIFFSSGTTGLPKGICCSHKAIFHQGFLMSYMGLLEPDAVILLFSTLYWVSACFCLTGAILSGGARVVCKNYDPENIWNILDKYKVTFAFFAPIQAYDMLSAGRPEGIDTSSLHVVVTGGVSFSAEKLVEFKDLLPGTFVFQIFGCTELSGAGTSFNLTKPKDRLLLHYKSNSCGRPLLGFEYKIVAVDTGKHCGPNETGEMRVKSEFILNGYFNQDSSSAFDEEGWLQTGDIMYYDEDFCFYVVGRIKEMLKFRSWHVPPAMLEGVLQTHPSVKECAVIGIPHETDGDLPMAIIVLHEAHMGNVTEEEIEKFVADRVSDKHKIRGGVMFIESMPVTPSGKVKKNELKKLALYNKIEPNLAL